MFFLRLASSILLFSLELLHCLLLGEPLLLELRGDRFVFLLTSERLTREVVVTGAHRDHRLALPLLGLVGLGGVLLLQLFLVGDRDRHRLLGLDQLLLHLEQHLGQHLLGILSLRDEIVDVGLDQRPESGKDPHGFHRAYGIKGVVATLAPSVLLAVLRDPP